MKKIAKLREFFREHPKASPSTVAVKFGISKATTYKARSQVLAEVKLCNPPELLPTLPVPVSVDQILDARAADYGVFMEGAALMQGMKRLLADHASRHNKTFTDDQWEALEMIVHKMARIVNGNPDKIDHWEDIAGYATLIADRLKGSAR